MRSVEWGAECEEMERGAGGGGAGGQELGAEEGMRKEMGKDEGTVRVMLPRAVVPGYNGQAVHETVQGRPVRSYFAPGWGHAGLAQQLNRGAGTVWLALARTAGEPSLDGVVPSSGGRALCAWHMAPHLGEREGDGEGNHETARGESGC